jgi:hypothetical protein
VVEEVRQEFASWLTQTVRLGADDHFATFEFTVGAIPLFTVADAKSKVKNDGSGTVLRLLQNG